MLDIGVMGLGAQGQQHLAHYSRLRGVRRLVVLAAEAPRLDDRAAGEAPEIQVAHGAAAFCEMVTAASLLPAEMEETGTDWSLWARRLLEQGRHLLLGLPPGLAAAPLQALLQNARPRDTVLQLAQPDRHHPGFEALFQLFSGGVGAGPDAGEGLSRPRYLEIYNSALRSPVRGAGRWDVWAALVRELDLLTSFPGAAELQVSVPAGARTQGEVAAQPGDDGDASGLQLTFANGAPTCRVHLHAGNGQRQTPRTWTLLTPAQLIALDFGAPALRLYPADRGGRVVPRLPFTADERCQSQRVEALFTADGRADWEWVDRVLRRSRKPERAITVPLPAGGAHRRMLTAFLRAWVPEEVRVQLPGPGPSAAPQVPPCRGEDGVAVLKLAAQILGESPEPAAP